MPYRSHLVGLIYEAVDDPAAWTEFLEKFAIAIHATGAYCGSFSKDKGSNKILITDSWGIDPAWIGRYNDHFVYVNPHLGHKFHQSTVHLSGAALAPADLVRTEYYNDFLRPNNWFHGAGAVTEHLFSDPVAAAERRFF